MRTAWFRGRKLTSTFFFLPHSIPSCIGLFVDYTFQKRRELIEVKCQHETLFSVTPSCFMSDGLKCKRAAQNNRGMQRGIVLSKDVALGILSFVIIIVVLLASRNRSGSSGTGSFSSSVSSFASSLTFLAGERLLPPTREPATASVHRGMNDLCHAVNTFESSLEFKQWAAFEQKESANGINEDRILEKVSPADIRGSEEKGRSPILLCIIITVFNDENAVACEQSWARKCDLYYFSSNKTDVKGNISRVFLISPVDNPNKNMWQRLRLTLKHVATRLHGRFDHVLVVTDDSHIVVENLRHMLAEPYVSELHKLGVPLFLGHRMVAHNSNSIFVSSSAIVLNSVAMQLFSVMSEHSRCEPATFSEQDDLTLAACFAHFGIYPLNTQDPFGADRVHLFDHHGLTQLIVDPKSSWWYPLYRRRPMPSGLDGVSARTWAFHYVDHAGQDVMDKKIATRF